MRNLIKVTLVVALAVGLTVAFAPKAQAFHDDGVAHCNGCHTMHNSELGALDGFDNSGTALLKGESASDVCLACHGRPSASYSVFTGTADPTAPQKAGKGAGGGDFVFLLEDNLNDGHRGASSPILGERGGHNVYSPAKGLDYDTTLNEAPGGTYDKEDLGCSSCHEPHGGKQFRFLHYGANPKTSPGDFALVAEVVADETSVFSTESNANHTGYQSGMADFCSACHGDFHSEDSGRLVHPTRTVGSTIATNYNDYDGTDQPASATPYLADVPVEFAANATSHTGNIDGTAKVMCLTCHRAHATSGPAAGRWDFNITLWNEDGVESGSFAIPNPYAATAGDHQRSLCNKCHVQDAGDL
jgi:hypothetical protein